MQDVRYVFSTTKSRKNDVFFRFVANTLSINCQSYLDVCDDDDDVYILIEREDVVL